MSNLFDTQKTTSSWSTRRSSSSMASNMGSVPTSPAQSEWHRRAALRRALPRRLARTLFVGCALLVLINWTAWSVGNSVLHQQLSVLLMASSVGLHHALLAQL